MIKDYDYIRYDDFSKELQNIFKTKFIDLDTMLTAIDPSRELSLAKTKLEEAYMWIGKAIRNDQIKRLGDQDDVPERGE